MRERAKLVGDQDVVVGDQHVLVLGPDRRLAVPLALLHPRLAAHDDRADVLLGVLQLVVAVGGLQDELDGHALRLLPADAVGAVVGRGGAEEVQAAAVGERAVERGGGGGAEDLVEHDGEQQVHQAVVLLAAQLAVELEGQVGVVDAELLQQLLDALHRVERHQVPRAHGLCAAREGGAPLVSVLLVIQCVVFELQFFFHNTFDVMIKR